MAPDEPTPDVMSSLPRTRPQRRSAKRDAVKSTPGTKKPAVSKAKSGRAAKAVPAAKPKKAAAKKRAPSTAGPRVRAVPRKIPPAGYAPPRDSDDRPTPGGAELIGTAVQAAGELAQIGLAVGGQALRSALGRLNRS